jgi:hypothetical protein
VAALAALSSDTARPGFDINRINRSFINPENISLKEAISFISAPREGTGSSPYRRASKGGKKLGGTPKKAKTTPSISSDPTPSSSGIVLKTS